jgi:hypothetical protein
MLYLKAGRNYKEVIIPLWLVCVLTWTSADYHYITLVIYNLEYLHDLHVCNC